MILLYIKKMAMTTLMTLDVFILFMHAKSFSGAFDVWCMNDSAGYIIIIYAINLYLYFYLFAKCKKKKRKMIEFGPSHRKSYLKRAMRSGQKDGAMRLQMSRYYSFLSNGNWPHETFST